MKASEILNHQKHRPFDLPKRPWKYYQEWNQAIFLHWEISPEMIQPFISKEMTLDTIDGKAWVSLVAFDMNHIGVRSLPKLPHISNFYEINIRTYVICKGKPSVYFLSMEGSKRSSCSLLKAMSKFPYVHSKMKRTHFSYESKNIVLRNSFDVVYQLKKEQYTKDFTDQWLTERYAVFQDHKNKLIEYDVHHMEWLLEQITIKDLKIDYPKFNHLMNNQPERMHYSEGVKVLTWDKRTHKL